MFHARMAGDLIPLSLALIIGFASVANRGDVYDPFVVINRVYDAVVADTDTPQVLESFELAATRRTRLVGERLDLRKDSPDYHCLESF